MKHLSLIIIVLMGLTQAAAQNDDYLPIVREGVQWVNEKVIVNHGDTTCYYYKYEFNGIDPGETNLEGDVFNALYYYTGDELNVELDSLIAGLRCNKWGASCFRNNPYRDLYYSDDKLLIGLNMFTDGGTIELYRFPPVNCMHYYLWCQGFWIEMLDLEPFMKEENIREVNPIIIEGIECKRCAYVDDQGDTLAYVVEGIGFDSYDLGDLLTPFSYRHFPDAEHQEWCGLSHVIKDGEIIYKGMRYRNENLTRIDEVVAEQPRRPQDDNYYNLMGQPVGKDVPTAPGIYIHHGQKICVSRTP
jgi:hypothetical protein